MFCRTQICLRVTLYASRASNSQTLSSASPNITVAKAATKQTRCLSTKLLPARSHRPTVSFPPSHQTHITSKPSTVLSRLARPASTATSPPASSSPSTSIPSEPQPLTWNTYLSLRQKRRYYNLAASALTGFGTFSTGASFILAQDIDKVSGAMFGLDPVLAMGIVCLGFGALGWLLGPFAGGAVFRLVHRRVARQMDGKERDFYHRIKKHRSDPTGQSMSNPVPDYYGEKIASVQGYRQWLKDQRAFKKKRENYQL